ncbi:MAG: site-specific integrase [Myxococcales bacterium]|nr:site-specific integrase [Myxococcales bacterium]
MKITTRPYANDTTRFHVDIRFMNPCNEHDTIRRRLVAPPGLDDKQARAWGERQLPLILRELVGATGDAANVAPKETPARGPRMTLAEFYDSRFMPEHVALHKRATQDGYHSLYANHIGPLLGDVALADIDEDRISTFRADLRKRIGVTTTNLVLSKLAKMLRFAKKRKLIAVLPEVEKLPSPKRKPKPVFSDQQIAQLNDAAAGRSSESLLICLLALDANLRVSEICALEWSDISFAEGTVTVQHNVYKGETQEPKGEIRTIALSKAVKRALAKHQQRKLQEGEPQGPLVLYRNSQHTGWEWEQHTPHSIRHALNESQARGELRRSGPHLLRHTGLTRLARLGATPYTVQSMARHARLQTTQDYLHLQQVAVSREAADLLDNAAAKPRGKRVAKRANAR